MVVAVAVAAAAAAACAGASRSCLLLVLVNAAAAVVVVDTSSPSVLLPRFAECTLPQLAAQAWALVKDLVLLGDPSRSLPDPELTISEDRKIAAEA